MGDIVQVSRQETPVTCERIGNGESKLVRDDERRGEMHDAKVKQIQKQSSPNGEDQT
jgi:hypothetical protein